jgi:MOSC domain-containing protein YiiM
MRIESINVGRVETVFRGSKAMHTGICKRSVTGPVHIGVQGIPGDAIVATEHHGGPDQAIYAYSSDDYDWWAESMGRDVFPGLFGENLTIRDMPSDMTIGDRLLIGEVVLEATAPRIPCDTFAAHMDDAGFGLLFRRAERPGVYFRVLNPGEVRAGDSAMLVQCDDHDVTVLDLFRYKFGLQHTADDLRRLLDAPIAERFRTAIENTLDSLSSRRQPPPDS